MERNFLYEDLDKKGNFNPLHNAIVGWLPSMTELTEAGYSYLPQLPSNKRYLIGGEYLEWLQDNHQARTLYVVSQTEFIDKINDNRESGKEILAYNGQKAECWLAGFVPLYKEDDNLEEVIKEKGDKEYAIEENVIKHTSTDETQLAGDIDRAFNLLGRDSNVRRCVCGRDYGNNCAHYLSNALIQAGFTLGSPRRGQAGMCSRGRWLSAMELRTEWVRRNARRTVRGHACPSVCSGTWIVFQQYSQQGRPDHICMHRERSDSYSHAGTGDYPEWYLQEHYLF